MNQTRPRFDVPMAMLVALSAETEETCRAILHDAAFHIERAENEAVAAERIATVMPHVVVVPVGATLDEITERTRAVGAELVQLAPGLDKEAIRRILRAAWGIALKRAR